MHKNLINYVIVKREKITSLKYDAKVP